MTTMLDAIKSNRTSDMIGVPSIQEGLETWTQVKVYWPKRSVYGKWLMPSQTVWRYRHTELCSSTVKSTAGTTNLYYRWFYLYLTDEEYIMTKMEN